MSSPWDEATPASPCVSICALGEDEICTGCFRSADEITDWFLATDEQKREIIAKSAARRDAASPFKLL